MRQTRSSRIIFFCIAFLGGLLAALWFIREPTEPLTDAILSAARRKWAAMRWRNYEVRYAMNSSSFRVVVRNDQVADLLMEGRPANAADSSLYSVDGLFDILQLELENQASGVGPFSGGSTVPMRARFHPQYGYVERFIRGGGGAIRSLVIEDVVVEPETPVNPTP